MKSQLPLNTQFWWLKQHFLLGLTMVFKMMRPSFFFRNNVVLLASCIILHPSFGELNPDFAPAEIRADITR